MSEKAWYVTVIVRHPSGFGEALNYNVSGPRRKAEKFVSEVKRHVESRGDTVEAVKIVQATFAQ